MAQNNPFDLNLKNLLLTYKGRLNRKPYNIIWFFSPFLLVIILVLTTLISPYFIFIPLVLIILIFYFFIILFTTIKRFHDRGYSGWWYAACIFLPLIILLLVSMFDPAWVAYMEDETDTVQPPLSVTLMSIISFGIYVWVMIETCFLRGTKGPNKYGPDPLENFDDTNLIGKDEKDEIGSST